MLISVHSYRSIKQTPAQALHARRDSHHEQHLNTLAALICGIVSARHVHFAQIADHAPIRGRTNESVISRLRRWVKHDANTPEAMWLPFASPVVAALADTPLTLVLDGTVAGRGCVVLIASVLYQGRAIPLLWTVVKGKNGPLPQELRCTLSIALRRAFRPRLHWSCSAMANVMVSNSKRVVGECCRAQLAVTTRGPGQSKLWSMFSVPIDWRMISSEAL